MRDLSMWVIYDHPTDFPDCFIARRWEIIGKDLVSTTDVRTSPRLDELRDGFARIGLFRFGRMPQDAKAIVEAWL